VTLGGVEQIGRRALCSTLLMAFETRSKPAQCMLPLELRSIVAKTRITSMINPTP